MATDVAALAPLAQRGNKRVLRDLLAGTLAEKPLAAPREEAFPIESFRDGGRVLVEARAAVLGHDLLLV